MGAVSRARGPLPVGAGRPRCERSPGRSPVDAGHAVIRRSSRLVSRPPATTPATAAGGRSLVCLLPVAASALGGRAGRLAVAAPAPTRWNDARAAAASLRALDMADRGETPDSTAELRDALEVLLASRYRAWYMDRPSNASRLSGRDLNLSGSYGAVRRRVLTDASQRGCGPPGGGGADRGAVQSRTRCASRRRRRSG